jgi:hypothetical protein
MSLIDDLRSGAIEHKKRWSGDTHFDLGGSIDREATEMLMAQAADGIERLRSFPALLDHTWKTKGLEAMRKMLSDEIDGRVNRE